MFLLLHNVAQIIDFGFNGKLISRLFGNCAISKEELLDSWFANKVLIKSDEHKYTFDPTAGYLFKPLSIFEEK